MSDQDMWRRTVLEYATSFGSIGITTGSGDKKQERIRLKRGPSDLMHTLGHFYQENASGLRALPPMQRLAIIADAIEYIAEHLVTG